MATWGFPRFLVTALCLTCFALHVKPSTSDSGLLVVTIATQETDGFRRFMRSLKKYDLDVKVCGMGKKWEGGDIVMYPGGGHKVNILKDCLQEYEGRDDLILLFTDSYDVVFTNGVEEILDKFKKLEASVVFSAEGFCWPDEGLADEYPAVKAHEKRYLNSGGFMGKASSIYEIITYKPVQNTDDDQLYYTKIFLDRNLRKKWDMKLDVKAEIFQNLNGALGDVTLKFKGSRSYLYNVRAGTTPVVVHGNGPIKPEFNRLANYLADSWTTNSGCLSCSEDTISLENMKEDDFPSVLLAMFVVKPTPFLSEFFQRIAAQKYPKKKIDIFIYNTIAKHEKEVKQFLEDTDQLYQSVMQLTPSDGVAEAAGRNWGFEECTKKNCQYYFSVDSETQLTNPMALPLLMEQNRSVIAPMLVRPGKLWSNFWGALSKGGYYARSEDYIDLVEDRKHGLWNIPFITGAYLIHGYQISSLRDAFTAIDLDPDMAMCKTFRDKGIFMYVSNIHQFGHLVNADNFNPSHLHDELYQIYDNPMEWEYRYMHENYSQSLTEGAVIAQPCPDVYWFPMVTPTFCHDLIEELENNGGWSGGKHEDARLTGGYENVPTDDIHMTQVGLDQHWLHFLKKYVSPLQQKVFLGYFHDPPHAILNFVVKYQPDRQPALRAHHDSSTFTINLALNEAGVDFEGGGCRFLRYNCSIRATRKGWMLMHPGRLTHFHEGLRVTNGTRYIFVSFVDP